MTFLNNIFEHVYEFSSVICTHSAEVILSPAAFLYAFTFSSQLNVACEVSPTYVISAQAGIQLHLSMPSSSDAKSSKMHNLSIK